MQKFLSGILSGTMAVAMILLAAGTHEYGRAQTKKNYKDNTEADLFGKVTKSAGANDWKQALADLDTWKQKYPGSDFKNDREMYFVQAYAGVGQWGKAVDTAGPLIDQGLDKVFDDPKYGPNQQLAVLFKTVQAITQVPNPTPEQLAIGDKAAHQLFDFNQKPQTVSDADWEKARTTQLQPPAKATMLWISMQPGTQAMAKSDFAGAEAAFTKALNDHPESAAISYNLGLALSKQKKNAEAVYEFQRAAVTDATLGGTSDATKIKQFADSAYTRIHGSTEGLDQLKDQVKASPLPPAGFKIKTATEIAEEKESEFEKSNPQLSMWMKIKAALSDTGGDQYFESSLKGAGVPQLKGVLVDAKPACRPKELLIAVPLPDAKSPYPAEISLKLVDADDKPLALTGKPDLNAEIQWEGVPQAFTKEPFLLTMNTEKGKIQGLKVSPCAVAPVHHPATKKK
ncbi:MAG TPA: tetratricopeptide repeat protein [Bryobacteraceae bacterium]|nr:tetratricopeptide repeat protein [Bryobacteraceae bacterium]